MTTNRPSEKFEDATLGAVNAMRLATHAAIRGGTFITIDDETIKLDTFQAEITYNRSNDALKIVIQPKKGVENGNVPATVTMTRQSLPGSHLFSIDLIDLPKVFAELFQEIGHQGIVKWLSHSGDDICLVHATNDGLRALAASHVNSIARGIDVLTGQPITLMRHPGLGTRAAVDPVTDAGELIAVPDETDPDEERRAAGARIRLAREWAWTLTPAIIIRQIPDTEDQFFVSCHAMTMMPSEDRGNTLTASMKAFAELSRLNPEEVSASA